MESWPQLTCSVSQPRRQEAASSEGPLWDLSRMRFVDFWYEAVQKFGLLEVVIVACTTFGSQVEGQTVSGRRLKGERDLTAPEWSKSAWCCIHKSILPVCRMSGAAMLFKEALPQARSRQKTLATDRRHAVITRKRTWMIS